MRKHARPTMRFTLGSSILTLNRASLDVLGTAIRAQVRWNPDTHELTIRPCPADDDGVKINGWTVSGGKSVRQALAAGFRKDRTYLGTTYGNVMSFHVDDWKEKDA